MSFNASSAICATLLLLSGANMASAGLCLFSQCLAKVLLSTMVVPTIYQRLGVIADQYL
jgi:hypothetical protein